MKNGLLSCAFIVKFFHSSLVFIYHFCHTPSSITFINVNSLVAHVLLCGHYISLSFLQLFTHAGLFGHEMRIDLGLLHQILKAFLLKKHFFLLLLAFLQLFLELFPLSLDVSKLFVSLLPKVEHVFG